MSRKVLFIFTSNDRLVNTSTKTGWYLPEAAHPYYAFKKQGLDIHFVSEKGGRPPLDQSSVNATKGDEISQRGPLIGLPENVASQELIRTFYEDGRVVSAICHAPAVLTEVKLQDGRYLVEGRRVTSMSNEEEEAWGRVPYVPFLVQDRLKERGATFIQGKHLWGDHVVVDKDPQGRKLVTGANPASGTSRATEVVKLLEE